MYESLYLHIPFCKSRCHYCDFRTEALPGDDPRMDAYLEYLVREVRVASKAGLLDRVSTLYIGGGTPTHFGHGRLVELGYLLSLSIRLEQVEEYTVEANPESLGPALVRDLFALGVDRLSVGVQSFVDGELVALGRVHDAAGAARALREARQRFDNLSLDLMCGIPGQTLESWHYSLGKALEFEPEHVSVYPLQAEEGTPYTEAVGRGELPGPDEDTQAEHMEQADRVLRTNGYHRYEVASYAKPGRESRHNSRYWTGASYLGIGSGAASMLNREDGTRERWIAGEEAELLSVCEALAEDILLAMRMSDGISAERLGEAGLLLPGIHGVFRELAQLGLVTMAGSRYLPTERGWLLGNEMYSRIWALADEK